MNRLARAASSLVWTSKSRSTPKPSGPGRCPRCALRPTSRLAVLVAMAALYGGPSVAQTFDEAEAAYREANASKDAKHSGYAKAFEIWSILAASGDAASTYHVGVLHLYGLGGAEFDQVRGFALIQDAAESGYSKADAYLAVMQEKGQGLHIVKNQAGALAGYRRAAAGGHCYSVRRLAQAHAKGELGLVVDENAAAEFKRHYPQCFESVKAGN